MWALALTLTLALTPYPLGGQKRDVLLVWGTEDTGVTAPMVSAIPSLVPRLTFKPVEDAGHGIVFQKPEIVNALLTDFLIK